MLETTRSPLARRVMADRPRPWSPPYGLAVVSLSQHDDLTLDRAAEAAELALGDLCGEATPSDGSIVVVYRASDRRQTARGAQAIAAAMAELTYRHGVYAGVGAAWCSTDDDEAVTTVRACIALRLAQARADATAVVWDEAVHGHLSVDDEAGFGPSDPPVGRIRRAWAAWAGSRPNSASLLLAGGTYLTGLGGPFVLYSVLWLGFGIDPIDVAFYVSFTLLMLTTMMLYAEGLMALQPGRTPPEPAAWPSVTAVIPAWLPNEHRDLADTLRGYLGIDYPGRVRVICAYNTDRPYPDAEAELARLARSNRRLTVMRVEGSRTKAQNLNAALRHVKTDMVAVFDADHHPGRDAFRRAACWIAAGWDGVQGRCTVRPGGRPTRLERLVAVEFEAIYGVAHPGRARRDHFAIFGGSNGYWRTPVLQALRFAPDRLTEDIDVSLRSLLAGIRLATDRSIVSSELAPADLAAFWTQRGRWAQGWTQVSHAYLRPILRSDRLTFRQKMGGLMLLGLREITPWVTLQIYPILAFHLATGAGGKVVWLYPIFIVSAALNLGVAAWQAAVAYWWADGRHADRREYAHYALHSILWFSELKMLGSRVAHLRALLGETSWRVTRRASPARLIDLRAAPIGDLTADSPDLVGSLASPGPAVAQRVD